MSANTPPPAAASDPEDPLGYDAYAKTLWERVEQALNRDDGKDERGCPKVLGDDPLVVGIFGEWGAGKSYLLNKIRAHAFGYSNARVIARQSDSGFGLTIPVFFQPWKYEHEEHLHVPLLMHILLALKQDLKKSQTPFEKANQWLDKYGDKLALQMQSVVDSFDKIVQATAVVTAPATAGASLAAISAMSLAKALAAKLLGFKRVLPDVLTGVRYTDEGRYYYEIHEHLKAITRPAGKENAERGYKLGLQIDNQNVAINFVIFIDDLDRCLPEKAVAVLELIKTIFNAESFAFVLALDDEVIERGIGHRYKDYALQGKKPEMPITGFEYLEKIVHVPFRLPALTREDALLFIELKESKLLAAATKEQTVDYVARAWFSAIDTSHVTRVAASIRGETGDDNLQAEIVGGASSSSDAAQTHVLNLAHLALNSFDAYVPRKLDRVVELFHQVAKVAHERGRPFGVELGGAVDPRIVLSLVLIQLFQPELFRCLRRTGTGFDQLRASFKDGTLSSMASDFELLDWACMGTERHQLALANDPNVLRGELPESLAAATKLIANVVTTFRHTSQRVRLPIVERLLEHRGAQRHVFDPLKLFAALLASDKLIPLSPISPISAKPDSTKSYFSLLALNLSMDPAESLPLLKEMAVVAPIAESDSSGAKFTLMKPPTQQVEVEGIDGNANFGTIVRSRLPEIAAVLSALTQFEPREQAEVVNRAGLKAGQIIDSRDATELRTRAEEWLRESGVSLGETQAKQILLRGLQYLAPHLAPEDAASFWALVADSVVLPAKPNELVEKPELAALYGDVRAALGCDTRFDEKRPYLLKEKFPGNSDDDEPLPGFVRIPAGTFTLGHKEEEQNLPRKNFSIDEPFYIARMLTTVAQYARFVAGKGYEANADIWGMQGLDWRTGDFYSKPENEGLSEQPSKRRPPDLRTKPWEWDAQLANVSRPVTGISWFEARAYARWLNAQMRSNLRGAGLANYEVRLPTDAQWERAARAKSLTEAHDRRWPWGDEATTAPQRANIEASGIGHVSPVGVFAPNAIGLYDMAGNAVEWMDNRYQPSEHEAFARVERDETLEPELLTLRGGSWILDPEDASCSFRDGEAPDFWLDCVGVRVVLSLAPSEA